MSVFDGFFILIILVCSYFFFKKFKLLDEDIKFSDHKKLVSIKKIPIILGGLYLCLIILIYFNQFSIVSKFVITLFFLLGLLSDRNFLVNTKIRFFLQFFLLTLFVYFQDIKIKSLSVEYLDLILKNNFFSLFFTVFCFAILINGTNFIDGLNGLVLGYYLIVIVSLFSLSLFNDSMTVQNLDNLQILFFSLLFLLLLNYKGLIFLGDGGSYLIGLIIGYYLIDISNLNVDISPYYVAVLLWYPAFENLFSLVRRSLKKIDISQPDNYHLHQMIYKIIKKKKYCDDKNINFMTSLIILIYNIPTFVIASILHSQTKYLVILVLFNVMIYISVYYFLSKDNVLKKKF